MAFVAPCHPRVLTGNTRYAGCRIGCHTRYGCIRRSPRMSQSSSGQNEKEKEGKARGQSHVTAEFGIAAMRDAIEARGGNVRAVAKECGLGFCQAFEQCYSMDDATGVFVVCGNGMNGLIGLQIAVELKARGYEPSVYAVGESKHIDFSAECEEHGIPLYDFVPSTMEFYFQVVIDALLGLGFDGGDIKPKYWSIYEMLISTRVAIASVDVPSGWDLQTGPRQIDVTADTFVKPEVLISIGAPKHGTKMFAGGYHFLAGRHLPQEYFAEHGVSVPTFPGDDAQCVLLSSNPFRFQGNNGEVYGRMGQYNATLFTKNPKRQWVDVEEEMDLWDEID